MNTFSKKTVVVTSLIFASIAFINCNKTENKKGISKTKIAQVVPSSAKVQENITYRKPIAFIAGFDTNNSFFYANARNYFQEKGFKIIDGQYSIEEIINWLNTNANHQPYGEIHIVNKSNPYKGMNLETVIRGDEVTALTLQETIDNGSLPKLKNVVNQNSSIIFHASGLANNKPLVTSLQNAFSTKKMPKVVTSPYHTIFGGEFSDYYLAQAYYVFYPSANSPGKVDLSKEISRKYPEEKEIDWYKALNNKEERYVGEAFYSQFAIPIQWEFDYHNADEETPTFFSAEGVMDWIEQDENLMAELHTYNVPIEKYRWTWEVKNSKLTIKGRTTGLCVLKPLLQPYGDLKHIEPDTKNKRLYAMK
jgi:hypothetical protein